MPITNGQAQTLYLLMAKQDDGKMSEFRDYVDNQIKNPPYLSMDGAFRAAVKYFFPKASSGIDDQLDINPVSSFSGGDIATALGIYSGQGQCPNASQASVIIGKLK